MQIEEMMFTMVGLKLKIAISLLSYSSYCWHNISKLLFFKFFLDLQTFSRGERTGGAFHLGTCRSRHPQPGNIQDQKKLFLSIYFIVCLSNQVSRCL